MFIKRTGLPYVCVCVYVYMYIYPYWIIMYTYVCIYIYAHCVEEREEPSSKEKHEIRMEVARVLRMPAYVNTCVRMLRAPEMS